MKGETVGKKQPEVIDLDQLDKKELKKFQAQQEAATASMDAELKQYELLTAERDWFKLQRIDRFRVPGPSDGHFDLETMVGPNSVGTLVKQVDAFVSGHADTPKKQKPGITFRIHSPGGYVDDGWRLFDELRTASEAGHKVTTVVRGMAASMAAVILQAGDRRVVGAESVVMIHTPSSGTGGSVYEIMDEALLLQKIRDRMVSLFAARSGGKITEKKLLSLIERRDCWLTAKEVLKYGICDEVG